jgi:hypothetical protein
MIFIRNCLESPVNVQAPVRLLPLAVIKLNDFDFLSWCSGVMEDSHPQTLGIKNCVWCFVDNLSNGRCIHVAKVSFFLFSRARRHLGTSIGCSRVYLAFKTASMRLVCLLWMAWQHPLLGAFVMSWLSGERDLLNVDVDASRLLGSQTDTDATDVVMS